MKERTVRKELILSSAIQSFRSKGLDGSTMDEIAKNAGFGKATLYYYFKSKEEIFNAILLKGWTIIWESIEDDVIFSSNPKDTFVYIVQKIAKIVNDDRSLYEFLFFASQTFGNASVKHSEWKEYQQKLYNTLLHLVEAGIQKNQFPQMPPKIVLKALGGIFHGMVFFGKNNQDISDKQIEKILNNLLSGYQQ